jgi:hypothetical protein
MSNESRRRRSADEAIETEITLPGKANASFAEVALTSTIDSKGRTYVERMREKAQKARRAHSS